LFLSAFVVTRWEQTFQDKSNNSSVDRSRSFHRVRSQSFFSLRLHPKSSLRGSRLPYGKRSGRPGLRLPDTILFFATILRNQARPNQSDVPLRSLPQDPRHTTD